MRSHKTVLFGNPLVDRAVPRRQKLRLLKKYANLALGAFRTIRTVHKVAPDFHSQIASNRARGSISRVGGTDHVAGKHHSLFSFEHEPDYRSRCNVADKSFVEAFPLVFTVVGLGHLPGYF